MTDIAENERSLSIRHYLGETLGAVETLRPVAGGGAQGAEVWHAEMASGKHVAVKRHAHAGAGEVEFGVLRMLHGLGAPVVPPLQWEPRQQLLLTAWLDCGTLATKIRETEASTARKPPDLRTLAHGLLHGLLALETAFEGLTARLPLSSTGERQRRHTELRARCRQAPETMRQLAAVFHHAAPRSWSTSLHDAWSTAAAALCGGQLTFGGRDCTPGNVLTDGADVWFLDFAVVGLDWPEARLAQYAAAVSFDDPALPPQSLLTHGEVRWYVESGCIESAQLDMHHLLLWSEVLRLLLDGEVRASKSSGDFLRQRLRKALRLALYPLAVGSPAEPVRTLIATELANEAMA